MTTVIPATVELFNADYRSLATVSWQKAVALMLRDAVHIVQSHEPAVLVRSPSREIELPVSVVLRTYAPRPYRRIDASRATREAVLRRDRNRCGYCGGSANTWDHILPRSRGGSEVWINMISACEPCNGRKADRTPEEAGMKLLWQPLVPRDRDRFAFG